MKSPLPSDQQIDSFLRENPARASEHFDSRIEDWIDQLETQPAASARARRPRFRVIAALAGGIAAALIALLPIPSTTDRNPAASPALANANPTDSTPLDEELFALLDLVDAVDPAVFDEPDMTAFLAENS